LQEQLDQRDEQPAPGGQRSRRVFVTGGSGFVGHAVVTELLARGFHVSALANRAGFDEFASRLTVVRGGLFDAHALDAGMEGADAVIHLVGIIFENPRKGITFQRIHVDGTRAVLEAAERAGVRRFLHMSSLGTRPNAVGEYHRTKYAGEELVRGSGLDWTIFRPSMIHGPHGEFMRQEIAWARKRAVPFLFMPYFGAGLFGTGGAGRLQPVFVDDVARAFVDAIEKPATVGKAYPLAGPDVLTWPALHRTVAQAVVGHRRWVMAIPAWKARLLTRIVPAALLPFNRDQVIMSQEDNTADTTEFVHDFGWSPRTFEETLQAYVHS
jgi:NADH dehydrogenase